MGYLLKEALKTLCGINQWSYAVFWKFGLHNAKLLIWEECYYGPTSCSGLLGISGIGNPEIAFQECIYPSIPAEAPDSQFDAPAKDMVQYLVNKMMMENHVNIVGQGLVGRVAFTGNHQWMLSENYKREVHPPEVLKEVCQQFSAGMQTVAVIPVLPHGIVQFGSCLRIVENVGFVKDVVSLVIQLGHVPGVLQSYSYTTEELASNIEVPAFQYSTHQELNHESCPTNTSSFTANGFGFSNGGCSGQSSTLNSELPHTLAGEIQHEMQCTVAAFQASDSSLSHCKPHDYNEVAEIAQVMKSDFWSPNRSMNGVAKAEVIPSNLDTWINQNIICAHSILPVQPSEHLGMFKLIPGFFEDYGRHKMEGQSCPMSNTNSIDACIEPQSGDDLFDIVGADFKNRLFTSSQNCGPSNQPATKTHDSDSGIFSLTGTDYLLDAVISNVHPSVDQSLDDNFSCRTTLTNTSSPSAGKASLPDGQFGVTDHRKADFSISKYPKSAGPINPTAKRTLPPKEDTGSYSQCSSIYDSWIEKGHQMKQNSSVSTGYSKKPQEMNKVNCKRLKPGENPRPRPKDRQMIQDRLKELREIIPNGAKCSIDALLERTIKHMCFLQSLAKHANKLKLTAESKIISKDGGLLLKDNFEGGATWAYEVGSQSMVCPIIVEDLNQPRQMVVEMLCDERGLFLEIADVIRGLGLTILKGLMETRNDKIWARFSVEANRDITRMEIFLSLVRLLQHNAESCNPKLNNMIQDDGMAQQFHPAASIPGTLRSEIIEIC